MAPITNRRRWFRFSVRSALIGVALASMFFVWLGWQVSLVRERKAILKWAYERGGFQTWDSTSKAPPPTVPFYRAWLGDAPGYTIIISSRNTTQEDGDRIARLFPESEVRREPFFWPVEHNPFEPEKTLAEESPETVAEEFTEASTDLSGPPEP